jgi:cytoskeletal protein CcmA (bactofilin family)
MLRRRHREDRAEDRTPAVEPAEQHIAEAYGPEMTILGRGADLDGTLVSAESIRIDGQAKGMIAARGDVILSSESHVEADIQAKNVVMGGTLKGNITALTKTELAEGGRVEGKIRSRVLVVQEGAVFSGQSDTRMSDGKSETETSAVPEDELQNAYDEATRRAADWYRTKLPGPKLSSAQQEAAEQSGASTQRGTSEPDQITPAPTHRSLPFPRMPTTVSTDERHGDGTPVEGANVDR